MLIGEKMLILLLDEKKGKTPGNYKQFFRYAIPASIIEDLRILGRIKIESEGKKALIILTDDTPTNEPILDRMLTEIINFLKTGKPLKLVKYLKAVGNKQRKWREQLWTDLEIKGIIQNKKGKYFLLQNETKEKLKEEVKDVVGHKVEPDERQKALIGFFKHTRHLKMISKKSDRDKQWVNSFTKDCLVPKIFARNVLMPAALKKGGKALTVVTAATGQISYAGDKFSADVSGTRMPTKPKYTIRRSPGDAILDGVKKVKDKKFEKEYAARNNDNQSEEE